ncbi:MAG: dTDP-4-dehydrorhamnose reductase [Chitinophagales bacterium]|nr:dTDP-4-dehydrorhamnose reductase [Chitinophagales bacterium]
MPKILVTGGKGQLAKSLEAASFDDKTIFLHEKENLNITDEAQINDALGSGKYDYVVNCAAYTAVDDAEDNAERAFAINSKAAGLLAKACATNSIKLVHISTDFVFNGESSVPYKETDETAPINVYGRSKLDGEKNILASCSDAVIIRTSWLYSQYENNFLNTMIRLGQERNELNVVNDQIGSPTYATDLAKAILKITHLPDHWSSGIYHYSNEGICSWFDFASAIMEMAKLQCKINPIPSSDYPTKAERPKFSVLDNSKIMRQFDLSIPNWKTSLEKCIKKKMNELAGV